MSRGAPNVEFPSELRPRAESHQSPHEQTVQAPIRLMILGPSGLFRESLGRLLASEPGFEITGECATAAEAMKVLGGSNVDLILLDFGSAEFIRSARNAGYMGRFLTISGALDVRKSALALKLSTSGIFLLSEPVSLLLHAIRLVVQGELWIDPKVLQTLASEVIDRYATLETSQLGRRERQVLAGIVKGHSNRKIGADIGLAENSVKKVVQILFSRVGVKTRSQLVLLASGGSTFGGDEHRDARGSEEWLCQPVALVNPVDSSVGSRSLGRHAVVR